MLSLRRTQDDESEDSIKKEHFADPREGGSKPTFAHQPQTFPGRESEMTPAPDFGEGSYIGHHRLRNKVALITGGDSGIGRAVALAYAREGADVVDAHLSKHADAEITE